MTFRHDIGTWATICFVGSMAAAAADVRYTWRTLRSGGTERLAGLAAAGELLVTWGDGIQWTNLAARSASRVRPRPALASSRLLSDVPHRLLRRSSLLPGQRSQRGPRDLHPGLSKDAWFEMPVTQHLAEGGCLLDVDGDGRLDLVVNEDSPKTLAWYQAPRWTRHVIDTGVDAPDMLPATLFGHRGVLLIHKRAQVRFYAIPADASRRWPARDLYSVYTPSWQGGLAMADVDGDGRPDILCGNYWIRAPESEELPWRLFAINTWTEDEGSGMMRVGWSGFVAAAQRLLNPGRVAWFERPADPKQLWTAHVLGAFEQPNSLEAADFDGDGRPDILMAERGAAGRLIVFHGSGFSPQVVRRGTPIRFVRIVRRQERALPDLVVVTPGGIEYGTAGGPVR